MVIVGAVGAATVIDCQPDRLVLTDLGLVCTPHPVDAELLDAIIDLVDHADDEPVDVVGQLLLPGCASPADKVIEQIPTEIDLRTEPDLEEAPTHERVLTVEEPVLPFAGAAVPEEPEYDVIVRVLGDIRVEGGSAPLAAKQTAVVAYIALHENVSADRLEDAVWASPTTTSRRKRLSNTISECRALIGRRHLPPSSNGRYTKGVGFVTDLELFDLRVARAATQPPDEAADTLRSALDLVTGRPFTYRTADRATFAWVDVESWASTWEVKVAAVAQRCAELLIDSGRADEAATAARRALDVLPTHTGMTEILMRAHAANGDRSAVRRIYDDHVAALEALELDEPDQSITDLLLRTLSDSLLVDVKPT